MKTRTYCRNKARLGQALNLTELSLVTGYRRSELAKMMLPLQGGKISLEDFKRVLRRRQDALEKKSYHRVAEVSIFPKPCKGDELTDDEGNIWKVLGASVSSVILGLIKPSASTSAEAAPMTQVVDRLRAPKSRNVPPAASRHRAQSPLHSNGL